MMLDLLEGSANASRSTPGLRALRRSGWPAVDTVRRSKHPCWSTAPRRVSSLRMRSIALVVFVALQGCGGSSSETPFPIEPNQAELTRGGPLRQARYVVLGGGQPDADGGIIEREQISNEPSPASTVRSTWGGETPVPAPGDEPPLKRRARAIGRGAMSERLRRFVLRTCR